MFSEINLNDRAHSHGGLLPPEVSFASSNWLNRASHYPIFSLTWYRYRSIAMLTITALACAIAGMLLSIQSLAELNGWLHVAHLSAIVVAPLLLACLLGPGLAVAVRRLRLPGPAELLALLTVLVGGLAASAGLASALAQNYEHPTFDYSTGMLITRNLPTFKPDVAIEWGDLTISAGPEIDKQYRPWYTRPATKELTLEERETLLQQAVAANGFQQQGTLAEGTVSLSKTGTVSKSINIGPFVIGALALLYLFWIGGILHLVAYARQRGRILDVLQREELKRAQSARNAAELRLSVLAAQIEPHFLFNTLASVRSAIATDPQRAEQIVDHMVGFLRSTIPQMRDDVSSITVSLASQMQSASSYLALMHERIPRLQFSVDSEPGLEAAQLPPLMLISLVENAVKHGVEPKIGTARIAVQARRVDVGGASHLEVSVSDDGVGFGNATSGGGIGLSNIQERLRTLFGSRASLTLKALPTGGVAAILQLPLSFAD